MSPHEPDAGGNAHEPLFFLHTSIVTAIGICAALYVAQTYLLSPETNAQALYYLAFIPARVSLGGSAILFLTSAATCSLLHASLAHLAVNMIWLAAFGAPLAERIGSARFAAFWLFTALCATGLHFLTHIGDTGPLVGASGVVSGAMGAAARFGFATAGSGGPRAFAGAPLTLGEALRSRSVITFVLVWALINYVTGAGMTSIDGAGGTIAWQAHIGGFLAGFFGLRLFDARPQPES
jgi:membrane associated rhomboid family serine protease